LSDVYEKLQGVLVLFVIAVLIYLYRMRSGKYRRKKYDRCGGEVYPGAAKSMAVGIKMWYPVVYFILADLHRDLPEDYPEKLLRLDLGLSKILSGSMNLTKAQMIGCAIVALFAVLALISLIRGLIDFLPHLNNLDLLLAYAVPFLFWIVIYTRLLFNFGGFRFDPNATIRDSADLLVLIPVTARFVIPIILTFLLYSFYHQMKDREEARSAMDDYYEIVRREKEEKRAEERRREEILSRPTGNYGGGYSTGTARDLDDLEVETPSPRNSGKATMQDMPSVIRDSSGRTYHRTSYGGTPATYTCDDASSTIAIYNVYQSENYWMNTNAGSFEIVMW